MITLLTLAAAMIAGLLFTRLAKLFHLPNVTAYLVAGLLIGPYVLNIVSLNVLEDIGFLTDIALGFIAFSIGGEFKLESLKKLGKNVITITMFQALAATLCVDLVLFMFGFDAPICIALGAVATATAPAATLMVVRQYKAKGPVTNTLLPVVALDDAVGLMVFAVSVSLASSISMHEPLTLNTMLIKPLIEISLSLTIGAILGFACSFLMRFFKSSSNRLMLVITFIFAGIAISSIYELSSLLLCMAISAVFVNFRSDAEKVLDVTDSWTPPLFLLFFVVSGAELDLTVLPTVGLLGVLYLLARSFGKCIGAYIGSSIVKADDNIRKYLGITLLPQAGVAIGMAQLAMTRLPLYGDKIRAVVLCATLVYELVGPLLTKIALTKAGEIQTVK